MRQDIAKLEQKMELYGFFFFFFLGGGGSFCSNKGTPKLKKLANLTDFSKFKFPERKTQKIKKKRTSRIFLTNSRFLKMKSKQSAKKTLPPTSDLVPQELPILTFSYVTFASLLRVPSDVTKYVQKVQRN